VKDLNKEFKEYYISPPVKSMLSKAKKRVLKNDWDRVYLIDGSEGSGKSLLGLQLGYFLDPTLNLSRVTFSGKEFSNAIDNATKGQCIIFDEAFNGLSSGGSTSKTNRLIVRKLMECRQRNLFIIIILPTFFLLQKYAAIFRSKALFHVYLDKKGNRGRYRIYNEKNKKLLYLNGYKYYSYKIPFINKNYIFCGKYPIDEQSYREKKDSSAKQNDEEEKIDKYYYKFGFMCKLLKEKYDLTFKAQADYLKECNDPIVSTGISRLVAKIKENTKCDAPNYIKL